MFIIVSLIIGLSMKFTYLISNLDKILYNSYFSRLLIIKGWISN